MLQYALKSIGKKITFLLSLTLISSNIYALDVARDWKYDSNFAGTFATEYTKTFFSEQPILSVVCADEGSSTALQLSIAWRNEVSNVQTDLRFTIDQHSIKKTGVNLKLGPYGSQNNITSIDDPNIGILVKKLLAGNNVTISTQLDGVNVFAMFSLSGMTLATKQIRRACANSLRSSNSQTGSTTSTASTVDLANCGSGATHLMSVYAQQGNMSEMNLWKTIAIDADKTAAKKGYAEKTIFDNIIESNSSKLKYSNETQQLATLKAQVKVCESLLPLFKRLYH